MDCIFCKIISGEIPCYKIYEDENTLAFLDISNDIEGHTLVIPKTHCINVLDANKEQLESVMLAIQKVSKHYVDHCGFDGVNIINNNNMCAEQSVMHLHFHILPRRNNDNLKILNNTKNSKKELTILQEQLKYNV